LERPNFFTWLGSLKMSGVTEILVIVLIVLGIFMLPRMMNRNPERATRSPARLRRVSGWMRTAVLASLLWPAIVALFLKPWNNYWPGFFYIGIGPVALGWGIFWVLSGFPKKAK
jgi:hypothetical protein